MIHEYGLRVAWVEVDGFHSATAWRKLCHYAREQSLQSNASLIETLDSILSEMGIQNPEGDDNIYFKTEADRLMFVLRWA